MGTDAAVLDRPVAAPVAIPTVVLVGNPNTGKTTVFNRLCGLRAKTSNFPGTTTAIRRGRTFLSGGPVDVVDLPGIYHLQLESPESQIVQSALRGANLTPDVIVVVGSPLSSGVS